MYSSVPEIAKLLRVSPEKIRNMIRKGEIQAVNIASDKDGRPRWRIHRDAFRGFERNRKSEAVPRRKPVKRLAKVEEFF